MMPETVLKEFEDAGALLKGHFILSSGLHSDTYLNKSIVATDAKRTERLCRALAETAHSVIGDVDYVVA
ncbi:MAG: orotate phosphoribosyltransferase, partial [Pseudomonadota bacterium]